MSKLETIRSKADRTLRETNRELPVESPPAAGEESRQRGLMGGALFLLLVALSIVLWHDHQFWFPSAPETESAEPVESSPTAKNRAEQPSVPAANRNKSTKAKHQSATEQASTENTTPHQSEVT